MNEIGQNNEGALKSHDEKAHPKNAWKKTKEAMSKNWNIESPSEP